MLYGMIMNPTTFEKIKDEGDIKENNGVTFFEGIVVGLHKNLEENRVVKCKTKDEYIKSMILLDLNDDPSKLEEIESEQRTSNRRSV